MNLTQDGALHEQDRHCQSAASAYDPWLRASSTRTRSAATSISCKRFAAWLKRSPDTATRRASTRARLSILSDTGTPPCIMSGRWSFRRCLGMPPRVLIEQKRAELHSITVTFES